MIAVVALCIASAGVSKAAAGGGAEQAQAAAAGATNQAKPTANPAQNVGKAQPADPAREAWRTALLSTHRSKAACATATYPDKEWHEVPCGPAPSRPVVGGEGLRTHVVAVGGGGAGAGPSLALLSGSIMQAEGSFDKVEGVTSENGNGTPNSFSLQLNTNPFKSSTCNDSKTPNACMGAVQFVYDSVKHQALIQYWLLFYGSSCPAGWSPYGQSSCSINSTVVNTPPVTIADLRGMRVTGSIGGYQGIPYDDVVAVEISGLLYATWSGDPIADAAKGWNQMEFNLFGDGALQNAVFNPGSTVVVHDSILIGTGTSVLCSELGWTGETNNLTMTNASPLVPAIGPPALVFAESYGTAAVTGDCENGPVVVQGSKLRNGISPIIAHRP